MSLAALDQRQVGVEEAVADRALVGEVALEVLVQVVEEQAADAARLAAMLEQEVLVAPALVRVVARVAAERLAQRARGAVPVQHVLVERIERRQVEAAAEPPRHRLAVAHRAEVAHVRVRGRQVGVARVEHQRHADRAPRGAGQLRPRGARRRRQRGAGHIGEADAGLLEHRAVAQDPRAPAAAFGALPRVLDEARAAVGGFDRGADAVLQAGEVVADAVEVGRGVRSWRAFYRRGHPPAMKRATPSVVARQCRAPARLLQRLLEQLDGSAGTRRTSCPDA